MKYEQDKSRQQNQDKEFLKWLSPSDWLVQGQLHSFREQRGKDTLQWARNLSEFQTWRNSELGAGSRERILWIRGPLGVGKSVMAGYFIELLKCLHPTAIVAYFFCRSGQVGLVKARDIVRTLAYQCIQDDPQARSFLDEFRKADLKIDDLGISFLIQKLLFDPLRETQRDIFIVLDGLDEADFGTMDLDRRPEIEVLLDRLAALSTARLLFISRPEVNVTGIIPHSIERSIGRSENEVDIDKYIETFIAGSEKLQTHFKNASVNPSEYFHTKANGIFLWAVLVINQLEKGAIDVCFSKATPGIFKSSWRHGTTVFKNPHKIR